jgi:hypothetical protein
VADRPASFEPIRILKALDRHRVSYIVIGALARVIHGADEVTAGLDISPSSRPENLRRLELAVKELGVDSFPDAIDKPTSLDTDAGELKIVLEPEGTSGYDDLRRAAGREPLGAGARPSVASVGDLARMLAAHGVHPDRLQDLRRIAEIEAGLGREL